MRISLDIISKNLNIDCKINKYSVAFAELCIKRIEYAGLQNKAEANILYMVDKEALDKISISEEALYFFVGIKEKELRNIKANYLLAEETKNIFSIFNRVNEIFEIYNEWEQKIKDLLIRNVSVNSITELLNISESIFNNPINVVDCNYMVVGMSNSSQNIEAYKGGEQFGSLVPSEIIENFRQNSKFKERYNSPDVYIYQDDYFPFRGLTKNIIKNGKMDYRIVVSEIKREISDSDFQLIELLAEYLEILIEKLEMSNRISGHNIGQLLKNIIESGMTDKKKMDAELQEIKWAENDKYMLAIIEPSTSDYAITTITRIIKQISNELEGAVAFSVNEGIIALINLGRIQKTEAQLLNEFTMFIRDNNFRCGISNYFNDIYSIKTYCQQAGYALKIGMKLHPMEWIHRFRDIILPYIYEKVTEEFETKDLLSPIYCRLAEYDKANDTEYIKTLKCYLENNMNATKTAEQLFIHRATIIFRLKRICELGMTTLKNPEELLHLYVSFYLTDK